METEKGTFKEIMVELGYNLSDKDLNVAFVAYKKLRKSKSSYIVHPIQGTNP